MPVSPAEIVRILLASLVLLLPGVVLRPWLLGDRGRAGAAGLAAGGLIGMGGLSCVLWVASRLDLGLAAALGAWFGIGLVALLVGVARRGRPTAGPEAADDPLAPFRGPAGTWLTRLLLPAAIVAIPFGTYVSGGADNWEYLNRAAQILRTGLLNAGSPYGPEMHTPYDPTFYGFIAAVARLSGTSVAAAWSVFPAVATPLEVAAVVLAAAWITGTAGAGLWSGLVYVLFYGPFFLFRNSVHHQMMADALFLVALGSVFLYHRTGRRRLLATAALLAGASATLHHFLVVQCTLTFGIVGLVSWILDRRHGLSGRRAIESTLAVALGLLPMVLVLMGTHLEEVDPKAMDRYFSEVYAPLLRMGPLYIPDPAVWYLQRFWHPIPALAVLAWFGRRLWTRHGEAVLGALLVAPLLVGMNPLLFPLVSNLAGLQVTTRILNMTNYPSVLLVGWALAEWRAGRAAVAKAGAPAPATPPGVAAAVASPRRALLLAALSLLLVLPQSLIRLQGDYFPASISREKSESPVSWLGALARLKREAAAGDMVLSDPITSYSIPTFAPLRIVAHQRADLAFQADDHEERTRAQATAMDPLAAPEATLAAMERYDARWIVLNRRFANPLTIDKFTLMAASMPGLRFRFEEDGVLAWSYDPGVAGAPPAAAQVEHQLLIPPEVFATFVEPGTGVTFDPATGIGGVLGPDRAGIGDTLYVTLYYEWRDGPPGPNWYPKLMREEAYGSRLRWLGRQLRGSVLGRSDAMLFTRPLYYEEFRRHSLRPGLVFADQFQLHVPPGLTPGRYALYVSPERYPTEGATGLRIGTVVIVPRRVNTESA